MRTGKHAFRWTLALGMLAGSVGCCHNYHCGTSHRPNKGGADQCGDGNCRLAGCTGCGSCCNKLYWGMFGCLWKKSNAIPETLPLGSTVLAHIQVMETNGEAADFIIYQHEFVGQTAELNSAGKDHVLEVAARMRSTPFPVLVERSENNSDPELDALRRNLIAQILFDLGNPDAQQRTVVAPSYGPGYTGLRGEQMYYQHIYQGGMNNGFGGGMNNGGIGNNGGGFF